MKKVIAMNLSEDLIETLNQESQKRGMTRASLLQTIVYDFCSQLPKNQGGSIG